MHSPSPTTSTHGADSNGIIVHEWIEPRGGAENVLDEMAATFPSWPIQCLWNDAPDRYDPSRVRESWIARTPLRRSKSLALPAMPATWRYLGTSDAEWVLCSSHLFSHHARFSGDAREARKYVYAHTPARYIWEPNLDTRGRSLAVRSAAAPLKSLDRLRAAEAHAIAANSHFVRERIRRCWDRDSAVIYPPVDVAAYARDRAPELSAMEQDLLTALPSEYVLGASRFVPYKQLERAIDVAESAGVAAVLAGDGPHREALESYAAASTAHVVFVHRPSQPLLRELYRRAVSYVFAPIEDFGIMPVEAMAAGTPVIARDVGGASETVLDGATGALIPEFTPTEMKKAVETASRISSETCTARAAEFSSDRFRAAIAEWVTSE